MDTQTRQLLDKVKKLDSQQSEEIAALDRRLSLLEVMFADNIEKFNMKQAEAAEAVRKAEEAAKKKAEKEEADRIAKQKTDEEKKNKAKENTDKE